MSVDKANKMVKESDELAAKTFPPWGGKERKEDAIEGWKKAAAIYKVSKEWKAAAKCYQKSAETANAIKQESDACNYYNEAGKALKNLENGDKEAIAMFAIAAKMNVQANRMPAAGKIYRQIGELEEKIGNMKAAMEAYNMAAEIFYVSDNMSSDGHQMMVKVAENEAASGNYKKAIEHYEKVSEASLENKLLAYGVKGYQFHCLLCKFADAIKTKTPNISDLIETQLEAYIDKNPALDKTPESKFVLALAKGFREGKYEETVSVIANYQRIYRPTPLLLSLITAIKAGAPGQTIQVGSGSSGSGSAGNITGGKSPKTGDSKKPPAGGDDDEPDLQGNGASDEPDLQGGPKRTVGDSKQATKQVPTAANLVSAAAVGDSKAAPAPAASASAAYAAAAMDSAAPAPVASAAPAPTPAGAAPAAAAPAPAGDDEPNMT